MIKSLSIKNFQSHEDLDLCQCGCGRKVKLRSKYIRGHNKPSLEACQKISKSLKGRKLSNEICKKMSKSHKGIKFSDKRKRNISESLKGRKLSDEHKQKISESKKGKNCGKNHPNFGKKLSEEHRKKLSDFNKGKKLSLETCQKISKAVKGKNSCMFGKIGKNNPNFGRKHLEETKRKISEALKGKYCGENSSNWKNGISLLPYCFEFTQDLKEFIKERDGYKCMTPLCDNPITKNNPLGVHHIDYDKKNCIPENLISNCRSCNTIANFNRDEWKEIYRTVIKQNYEYYDDEIKK